MSRSTKKGPYVDENVLKRIMRQKDTKSSDVILTWARSSMISPDFVGQGSGDERREQAGPGIDGDQRDDSAERQSKFFAGVNHQKGADHTGPCGAEEDPKNHQPKLGWILPVNCTETGKHLVILPCDKR